jgi:hypothetical protein
LPPAALTGAKERITSHEYRDLIKQGTHWWLPVGEQWQHNAEALDSL